MADRFCKDCGAPVGPYKQRCIPCGKARRKSTNSAYWKRVADAKPLITCAHCKTTYTARPGNPMLRHLCQPCALSQRSENVKEYDRARQVRGSRKNVENARAYTRNYKRTHAEWNQRQVRLYQKRHPEKMREQQNRRRARKVAAGGNVTIEEFWLLCEQRGWRCAYCGDHLPKEKATMDHIVPLSRGGSNDIKNITPCCRRCNASKGNRLLSEWSGRLQRAA